jgi:adenine-specific DNA methylase
MCKCQKRPLSGPFYEPLIVNTQNTKVLFMSMAPLCQECGAKSAQVNYIKNGRTYYRSKCHGCSHGRKKPTDSVLGYRKKSQCERCGFKPRVQEQLRLHHADHNQQNTNFKNLRTVCCNCAVEFSTLKTPWTTGDLLPDF